MPTCAVLWHPLPEKPDPENGYRLAVSLHTEENSQREHEGNSSPARTRFASAVGIRLQLVINLVARHRDGTTPA
jgi:hypothetical protein